MRTSRLGSVMRATIAVVALLMPVAPLAAQVGPPTFQDPDSIGAIHDSTMYGGRTTDSIMKKLGWQNYRIWEYNDEQRLNNGEGIYGPIAHIFASDSLRHFNLTRFTGAGRTGKLVAVLFIQPRFK